MNCARFPSLLLSLLGLAVCLLSPGVAAADLKTYVDKPEPKFKWELVKKTPLDNGGTVYDLKLISQEWQQILWEHDVQVIVPKNSQPTDTMFLWNQGGKASPTSAAFGMILAERMQGPVAMLFGIPKQPLFGGKKEDALIAETFIRFLETKDPNWPLLFPMVKSLVKCMDALQDFSAKEMNKPVKQFIVSGGSKRGWTTWLTASVDPRVKAIAPLVIDTLNMQKQLPHQVEMFGAYSEQIGDYTARGLVPMPDLPQAKQLWAWVDPWMYRAKYTMPKLIINGANDPYWTVDALNYYWDDLPGEKWVIIVPNAGHNLEQNLGNGQKSRDRAVNGMSAFARLQFAGKSLPKVTWKHSDQNGQMLLKAGTEMQPKAARLWIAHHSTKDFRKATWEAKELKVETNGAEGMPFKAVAEVQPPSTGYVAFYLEFEFQIDGLTFPLCTQIRWAGK
jgi:PhoPQ-activated pathogenicity-related protein